MSYTYNAEDIRICSVNGSTVTRYTYDTNARLSRLFTKTTSYVTTKYVYGLGLIGEETSGSFKTYHFDYRGSTVAITNSSGTVTDRFQYDTYGKLISRTGSTNTPFLYNGRDGVMTDSNGLCYMRARYYSPVLRRFINADIVAGALSDAITLNRYAYANGNPVSNIDPFGLSAERGNYGPTTLEAAHMAKHIYNAKLKHIGKSLGREFGGWKLFDIYTNNEGLKIGIYIKEINGITCYTLVNKGSSTTSDWINNFQQPFGSSTDMKDSIAYAKEFIKTHLHAIVTFTGHSKGGAEAIANAVATNSNAIVFNPAPVNLESYHLNAGSYSANAVSYVTEGEVLDTYLVFLPNANYEKVYLKSHKTIDTFNSLDDPAGIKKHGLGYVIDMLHMNMLSLE